MQEQPSSYVGDPITPEEEARFLTMMNEAPVEVHDGVSPDYDEKQWDEMVAKSGIPITETGSYDGHSDTPANQPPDETKCPSCGADISPESLVVKPAGETLHMEGRKFRSVLSFCKSCGHSFGFSGLIPTKSAYRSSPHAEDKKRLKRRLQKKARKGNRR